MTDRLLDFVVAIHDLVEQPELPLTDLLDSASQHMKRLTAHDDWLPAAMAQPHADRYQQYLLYGDPLERFSVVSFVWGPGQSTPVHDHTVWGVIGVLRGSEISAPYRQTPDGRIVPDGPAQQLHPGEVACVAPSIGDIHAVTNASDDAVSISIHLYGGNIGRIARHIYDTDTGRARDFVSGYANALVPNLWTTNR